MKYTRDRLTEAAQNTDSVYGVIRFLGGNPGSGGTHQLVRKRLKQFSIDTSHFPGLGYNKGRPSSKRKTASQILTNTAGLPTRRKARLLRRALLEIGREFSCVACGLGGVWNGKKITLQVDHIDGNWRNNTASNLQFLCPNCHSQKD
jgi:hypothetical protein